MSTSLEHAIRTRSMGELVEWIRAEATSFDEVYLGITAFFREADRVFSPEQRIDAALELHWCRASSLYPITGACAVCRDQDRRPVPYPCATVRVLRGD